MKRQFRTNDRLSELRAAADADDGQDPRDFFKRESSTRGQGRKTRQLCAQVTQTLEQLLGEAADAQLQALHVVEVAPAPDASQLVVLLASLAGGDVDPGEAEAALGRAAGWLRSEIAAAIHRKRAPSLIFRILPAASPREVQP